MKAKILNGLLIITSLLGYLEWGGNNHILLFQAEAEIFSKLLYDPQSVIHPLILMPLAGQVLLLITLFQKTPNKRLTYIAIGSLGLLLGFMLFIGLIDLNLKIIISTIPFLTVSVYTILQLKKKQ
ncbi:MAG: hypothetical protein U0W65_02325 [Bacteroidia bacterium]|nr:hypothetical protein [Bacteroidia bacterium]